MQLNPILIKEHSMSLHRQRSRFVLLSVALLLVFTLAACVAPAAGPGGADATAKPKLTIWASTTFTPDADKVQDDQIKLWPTLLPLSQPVEDIPGLKAATRTDAIGLSITLRHF